LGIQIEAALSHNMHNKWIYIFLDKATAPNALKMHYQSTITHSGANQRLV